jgi:hypothetical protein
MLTIEELGLTHEKLQERVIEAMADRLLRGTLKCEDEGEEYYAPDAMQKQLRDLMQQRVRDAIERTAAEHVLPRVDEMLANICMQQTNEWGEKTGKAMTFTEFLVAKAEAYMQDKVDHSGKSKSEAGGWSWDGKQTRLTFAVHQHLQYAVERAMKQIIGDGNKQLTKALEETCRLQLNAISEKLRVNVELPR